MAALIFFTSDTHFGHANIIRYAERPFGSTEEMDEAMIANWNALVAPEDTVYHLGDVALGKIADSLPKVKRLNGHKIAVLGNHDRPFMRHGKPDEGKWWDTYREVFEGVWHWAGGPVTLAGVDFWLSHFPYNGDSHGEDRYADQRPVDKGLPLIHGHIHTDDRVTYSDKYTPQIHVGQDAWGFRPVAEVEVLEVFWSAA